MKGKKQQLLKEIKNKKNKISSKNYYVVEQQHIQKSDNKAKLLNQKGRKKGRKKNLKIKIESQMKILNNQYKMQKIN